MDKKKFKKKSNLPNINSFKISKEQRILEKLGYVIASDLGEGTYSKVKSAVWQKPAAYSYGKNSIKVALKIINKKTAPKDFLEKFLPRELNILKTINHKNIIKCYDILEIENKTYISLEWAGHGDLLNFIRLKGNLKEPESCQMFLDLLDAIKYIHGLNIVHRDLKCENILLSRSNQVKLADFGFARILLPRHLSRTFCGSAAYAAPELLQGIPYIGTPADVWSLGVILYIMLCSSMPFRDTNVQTLLTEQRETLVIPKTILLTLSKEIVSLLSKILNFDPKSRFSIDQILSSEWVKMNLDGHIESSEMKSTNKPRMITTRVISNHKNL